MSAMLPGGARRALRLALALLVLTALLGALGGPGLPWSGRAPWFAAWRAGHAAAAVAWLAVGSLGLVLALRARRTPATSHPHPTLASPPVLWVFTGLAFLGLDALAAGVGWLAGVDPDQLARLGVASLRLPAWGLALAWLAGPGTPATGATGPAATHAVRGSTALFWVTTVFVAAAWVAAVLPGPVTDAVRLTAHGLEGVVAAFVLARAADLTATAGARTLLLAAAGWAVIAALLDVVIALPPLAAARSTATSLAILMADGVGATTLPLLAATLAALDRSPGAALRPRLIDLALAACVITLLGAGVVQGAAGVHGWDPATARVGAILWLGAFDVAGVLLALAIAVGALAAFARRPVAGGGATGSETAELPPVPGATQGTGDASPAAVPDDPAPPPHQGRRAFVVGPLLVVLALIPAAIHGRDVPLPSALLAALPPGGDALEEHGRRVFVAGGCWSCHLPDRATLAGAPDLTRQGGVRSAGWHALHLDQPGWARANSRQPPAPWLFTRPEAGAPRLDDDGRALVAYLLRLQRLPERRGGTPPGSLSPADTAALGADDAFRMYCSRCHGTEGDGDGPAAAYLVGETQPRALTRGAFRLRSTADGPTRGDVLATLRHGLPGSAMPDFAHLPESTLQALVDYVFELGGIEPAPAVAPPTPTPSTPQAVRRGAQLADTLDCARCHGPELGGATATELGLSWSDEAGRPLPRAPDLARDPAKAGDSAEALYRTLFVGQEGSPMPSYAAALPDPEDRWALVHFLRDRRQRAGSGAPRPGSERGSAGR